MSAQKMNKFEAVFTFIHSGSDLFLNISASIWFFNFYFCFYTFFPLYSRFFYNIFFSLPLESPLKYHQFMSMNFQANVDCVKNGFRANFSINCYNNTYHHRSSCNTVTNRILFCLARVSCVFNQLWTVKWSLEIMRCSLINFYYMYLNVLKIDSWKMRVFFKIKIWNRMWYKRFELHWAKGFLCLEFGPFSFLFAGVVVQTASIFRGTKSPLITLFTIDLNRIQLNVNSIRK